MEGNENDFKGNNTLESKRQTEGEWKEKGKINNCLFGSW
jgi:hypothetical protein